MFLLRKPIRKETDVFDLHDTYQLEAYNYLLARDGLDLKIIEQKEYSVKGGPGFDGAAGTPDALYMRVTYELLNENYEPRRPGTRAQVDKVRGSGKKKASEPTKKRPKVITRDQLNAKDIAAANGIQFEDGKPVIDVDASTPAEPPKVVALDLYRAADAEARDKMRKQSPKKGKSVDEILESATEALNGALEHAADALEKSGITPNATKKRYTKAEVAEGVLKELAKNKKEPKKPSKPRKPKDD